MVNDVIYKPLIQDFTWSYSRIDAFFSCKWKFFLRYIRGLQEDDTFFASYGSFMHRIIERFYSGNITKDEMVTEFVTRYRTYVKGHVPANVSGSSYIQKGIDYLRGFEPFPFNMVAVEKRFDFHIDGIPFTGIIDYLGEKDSELYIVDNKSRDLKPRSGRKVPTVKDKELDEMLTQLYLYSVAVEQEYGKLPAALCFNCFKNGQFIIEPFDMQKYEAAKQWAVDSVHIIEDNMEWDTDDADYFKCNYLCGLHDKCDIYLER